MMVRSIEELTKWQYYFARLAAQECKDIREKLGLTQYDMADIYKIRRSTIALIEVCKCLPGRKHIMRLYNILNNKKLSMYQHAAQHLIPQEGVNIIEFFLFLAEHVHIVTGKEEIDKKNIELLKVLLEEFKDLPVKQFMLLAQIELRRRFRRLLDKYAIDANDLSLVLNVPLSYASLCINEHNLGGQYWGYIIEELSVNFGETFGLEFFFMLYLICYRIPETQEREFVDFVIRLMIEILTEEKIEELLKGREERKKEIMGMVSKRGKKRKKS